MQVLADGAFADQHRHALGELLAALGQVGHLVVGPDAGAEITVQPGAAKQRAVAVDRAGLKGGKLGEAGRIAGEQTRKIHEFGEPEHLRMVGELYEVADLEPGAGGLEVRGGHAARKLHPEVHGRRHRAVEEISEARLAEHVADLVRIADRGRHAVGEHAAVEFERRDQRQFDVAVGVDEAGHDDLAADVDLADARIFAERADDPIVADGDVAFDQFAADEIEDPSALQDDVGLGEPLPLLDRAAEKGDGVAHG